MKRLVSVENYRFLADRRTFLGVVAGLLGGCDSYSRSRRSRAGSTEEGGLQSNLPVRERPRQLELYPASRPILSATELSAVAHTLVPPLNLKKYPPSVVYHALRLWGREATFSGCPFARRELNGRFGERMLQVMLDEKWFQALSAALADRMLEPSQYGVLVRTTYDGGRGSIATSTHPGTYLQVLGELGVSSREPLRLADGGQFRVADVVNDDARRVHPDAELEWMANGLARYLVIGEWQNRFGEWVGLDLIGEALLARRLGQGACLGTHVPYALAALANLQQKEPLIKRAIHKRIIEQLKKLSALLSRRQRKDGAWDDAWFRQAEEPRKQPPAFDVDQSAIEATGHHLEWMTICPPEWRPEPAVIAQAANFLAQTVPELQSYVRADWHRYLPFSHAGKALFGLHGRTFAAWPDESHSKRVAE